jgi:hypothetical protein
MQTNEMNDDKILRDLPLSGMTPSISKEIFRTSGNGYQINMPNILTYKKILIPGYPYMYYENGRFIDVRLLNVRIKDNFLHCTLKYLQSGKEIQVSQLMEPDVYMIWYLMDLDYFYKESMIKSTA